MKKKALALLGFFLTALTFGQTNNNEKLIELGKTYKDYMFRNEPNKEVFKDIRPNIPENLKVAADFIVQTITTKNKLFTQQFLSRPEE